MSKDAQDKEKNVNKLVKPSPLNPTKSLDASETAQASSTQDSQPGSQNSSLYE